MRGTLARIISPVVLCCPVCLVVCLICPYHASMGTMQRKRADRAIDASIGERAHLLIWRARRTQSSVANETGVEATGFGKKLKGQNGWAVQEVVNLAAALGTTVSYLVGETENPHPVNPDGGDSSHLGDSNPRPIHYMRRSTPMPAAA